jgi:hypothetical protein
MHKIGGATAAIAILTVLAGCGATRVTKIVTNWNTESLTVTSTTTRYEATAPPPPAQTVTSTVTSTTTVSAPGSTGNTGNTGNTGGAGSTGSSGTGPGIEGPGSSSHATDTEFCATHSCIPNFPNGKGTIVQCVDGEWSHSGGLDGACSDHGGVG